jgi:hypothetical protein
MKVTKHRQRILDVLQEWFRSHEDGPTLEELCRLLEMQTKQKATVQRWLQTLRGIDVEWEDHSARSLHLLRPEPQKPSVQISAAETLRYLATGVVQWEELPVEERSQVPEPLRIGLSRMYLTSMLQGEEPLEQSDHLCNFFRWAERPICSWPASQDIRYLSPEVTLVEDGIASDFARSWQVTGSDVVNQVQESFLKDLKEYCETHQLEDAYRAYRYLVITQPALRFVDYRQHLDKPELRPLREFLRQHQPYIDLDKFAEEDIYHFCSRCKYVERRRADRSHHCRNHFCETLSAKTKSGKVTTISKEEASQWIVVTPGIYTYGTLPGIWEVDLAAKLSELGIRVTLWPHIDQYDLLVELTRKVRWAIDVKDWTYLDEERLKRVQYRTETTETFIVFPDEREDYLRIRVRREQLEPELKGVRLRLFSEVIADANAILEQKKNA